MHVKLHWRGVSIGHFAMQRHSVSCATVHLPLNCIQVPLNTRYFFPFYFCGILPLHVYICMRHTSRTVISLRGLIIGTPNRRHAYAVNSVDWPTCALFYHHPYASCALLFNKTIYL